MKPHSQPAKERATSFQETIPGATRREITWIEAAEIIRIVTRSMPRLRRHEIEHCCVCLLGRRSTSQGQEGITQGHGEGTEPLSGWYPDLTSVTHTSCRGGATGTGIVSLSTIGPCVVPTSRKASYRLQDRPTGQPIRRPEGTYGPYSGSSRPLIVKGN
jgi:hypothetical protein